MFTGIITDVGEVVSVAPLEAGARLAIATAYEAAGIALGASIACAGICLTVVGCNRRDGGATFEVDVSTETLQRTTVGGWRPGRRVNLERALRAGDELGGHILTGHIDAVARVIGREPEGDMARFTVEVPESLSRYIAPKGSVALDGTSLTVNDVAANIFAVTIIPHTLAVTTWGERERGDSVNLEVDLFARYVERLTRKA